MDNENKKTNVALRPIKKGLYFLRSRWRHLQRKHLSESAYPNALKKWFKKKTGEDLDLEDPKTFNQKIQWMKLYDSTPEKGRLADKYTVREWIEEQIGSDYLVPLLGVWDDPEAIDFNALPDRFVLKATHGCMWNIIVSDKFKLNRKQTVRKLKKWLNRTYGEWGFELQYRYCEPRIIAEKYLEETIGAGARLANGGLIDYKIFVFSPTHAIVQVCADRFGQAGMMKVYYDETWTKVDLTEDVYAEAPDVERPAMFDEMLAMSHKLAAGFSFVRIDWYVVDGKLYFSEMTFTPKSGTYDFHPAEYNEIFGSWVELPDLD